MNTVRITLQAETGSGHRSGWYKHVTDVDLAKKDGYAFIGTFLRDGENDLPIGAIIVEQYPSGSVKNGTKKGIAYVVTASGLERFAVCDNWYKLFLSFRDAIAERVKQ